MLGAFRTLLVALLLYFKTHTVAAGAPLIPWQFHSIALLRLGVMLMPWLFAHTEIAQPQSKAELKERAEEAGWVMARRWVCCDLKGQCKEWRELLRAGSATSQVPVGSQAVWEKHPQLGCLHCMVTSLCRNAQRHRG